MNGHRVFLVVALAAAMISQASAASNSWFNLHNRAGLFLEVHRASLERRDQYFGTADQNGWVSIIGINALLQDNIHAVAEIPIAGATHEWSYVVAGGGERQSDVIAGNPHVGVTWSKPGESWIFELMIMPPVMPGEEWTSSGQVDAMFVDKIESFEPKGLGIEIGLGSRLVYWNRLVLRSMARLTLQDGFSFDIEIDAAYEFRHMFVQASHVSRRRVSPAARDHRSDGSYGSQLMFAAGPRTDKLEAGISMIVPLEEFVPYAPSVVCGVNLRYFFEAVAEEE